jgi:competence protein ComEC
VRFEVLHPAPAESLRGNNASCVLRVSNAAGSVLLTGDIEAGVERRLLQQGALSPVDILVVPHHGSRSSSLPQFVDHLAPEHVLYATGWQNRWGFPRPKVVARWSERGSQGWNTASDGALRVAVPATPDQIRVSTYRRRQYWQP